MKQKLQRLCRIANTAMAAVPSLAGRVRMGLLIAIMMPIGAWAQNSTPTYIASIGVAQDGSSGIPSLLKTVRYFLPLPSTETSQWSPST